VKCRSTDFFNGAHHPGGLLERVIHALAARRVVRHDLVERKGRAALENQAGGGVEAGEEGGFHRKSPWQIVI
jgi:hypothetical protein